MLPKKDIMFKMTIKNIDSCKVLARQKVQFGYCNTLPKINQDFEFISQGNDHRPYWFFKFPKILDITKASGFLKIQTTEGSFEVQFKRNEYV